MAAAAMLPYLFTYFTYCITYLVEYISTSGRGKSIPCIFVSNFLAIQFILVNFQIILMLLKFTTLVNDLNLIKSFERGGIGKYLEYMYYDWSMEMHTQLTLFIPSLLKQSTNNC